MPRWTLRMVATVVLVCGLFGLLGFGLGFALFMVVDRLFDVWPNEPPFQWVVPALLFTYGGACVGVIVGGCYAWSQARWRRRARG